jgi:predicted nucleotidyltransferase component of viral defense system
MNNNQNLYFDILSKQQKQVLAQLEFLKHQNFYLAGGTALALQLNHRKSIDFDYYNQHNFNPEVLYNEFQKRFDKIKLIRIADGTLILTVNNISISFFKYKYDLISPLINSENVLLCSTKDITAMKMIAISQRGTKRDFIDLYFILKKFDLEQILKFTIQKFPTYNKYLALRALTYFEDAEKPDKIRKNTAIFENVTWKNIKSEILFKIKKYLRKNEIKL